MRVRALVLAMVVAAGCVDSSPAEDDESLADGEAEASLPATRDEILNATAHLKIPGRSTLAWNLANGTLDRPEADAVLVYFTTTVDRVTLSRDDGSPLLVAVVPYDAMATVEACGAVPPGVGSYFRPWHGTGNSAEGNFSGTFRAGWYHVVVVADQPASLRLTFGSTEHLRPRPMPNASDPFVDAGGLVASGGREHSADVAVEGAAWALWARHTIGGFFGGVDGGHRHSVEVNDGCRAGQSVRDLPFLGQQRSVDVDAAGAGARLSVAGSYAPNQPAAAPSETTLSAAWVVVRSVEIPSQS